MTGSGCLLAAFVPTYAGIELDRVFGKEFGSLLPTVWNKQK